MTDIRELYQEVILDHNHNPRNRGEVDDATHSAAGYNPLCGDRVQLTLKVENGVIREARFDGAGCAISTASASMLTESLAGKTPAEARELIDRFHAMVMSPAGDAEPDLSLGKLAAFAGVSEFPVRVKCATLAWHTLRAALDRSEEPITTEDDE